MAPGIADQKCKGVCGRIVVKGGYMFEENQTEHFYKDDYCKDCYIKKLELDNERLGTRVAHYEKVLANPPAIY